ncbi:anti-sigma factor family protein [Tateyamaria sp. SN6-1]|uniref:anti-sigma factor family protein n=1 Tax=Tateyamaria sp. SN6-1 TaxID=3092148 RepID=UPI0039F5C144
MTQNRTFTDEELTAFLDGEADDALAVDIGDALETDAELSARLAALDFPVAALSHAYDALLQDAPAMPALPEAVPAPEAAPASRFGWGWGVGTFGTGLAAGLAVAVFTGFGQPEPAPPPGWAAFVASYQSLYTPETLATVSATEAERAAQLARVSQAVGLDLTTLPEAPGLTFKRAQVLGFNGKPLVQLAYQRDDGTPVALCIIPAGPDGKPVSMGAAQGMDLARWNTPGFGFLLIGGTDQAPLVTEAETFQSWSVGDAI